MSKMSGMSFSFSLNVMLSMLKTSKIDQMYVKDVEDGKRTYTHIFAHNFLSIQPIFNLQKVLRS